MKNVTARLLLSAAFLILIQTSLFAQTTGKIAGVISDANTDEPLTGANVILKGTYIGTAVGLDGTFYIINVPPGTYTVSVQMIGYETVEVENLRVSVNRTAYINVKSKPSIMEGEVIVVQADKMSSKKDQTSSMRTVSSEQMETLPIEDVQGVVSMQAGVVNGHFRGGRSNEVSYLVDGLQVDDAYGGEGRTVDLETEAIEDLEVITGTFNAEYGRAMSGIVNAVTKDGGNSFKGNFSTSFANYLTSNKDIFIGLKDSEFNRNQDYKLNLSGPIIRNKLTFFLNTRYQNNLNHLNGIKRFNVDDYSEFSSGYPEQWYSEHNGDNSYVSMNGSENISFMGKLTYNMFNNFKLSLLYTLNDDQWHNYDHIFKYNPNGMASTHRKTNMASLHINHMLAKNAFYELKLSYSDNYNGWYVYKDPTDSGYVHDIYLRSNENTGFYTGGQQKGHSEHTLKSMNAKFDITWQINNNHSIKSGLLYTKYNLDHRWYQIMNYYYGQDNAEDWYYDYDKNKRVYTYYKPVIYEDKTANADVYNVKPIEFSAYIQDKMEYEDMVINFGVRVDYFDPNTYYPSQRRNPANQLSYPDDKEKQSIYLKADQQIQVSPRLGFAYQLGKRAVLRFSYGHFFQMPPMYALYQNHSFLVVGDYETTMGNAQLNPQKTVKYEIGLWQELMEGMGIEVALFYNDIYDLLSAKIISTYNQLEYGLYSNKDYGNSRGLELKFDFTHGSLVTSLNYTLQYTRGNADNPIQTFDRAGNFTDPVNRLIPMSWDQRHTLNVTAGYYKNNYGLTLTGYYNSGTPYTWQPISYSRISPINLYPNNDYIPSRYTVDLNSFYSFDLYADIKAKLTLSVYNLLDHLNEEWVNSKTGRAYTDIIKQTDLESHHSDFNTYLDRVQNPAMYSAPRMVKLGLGVSF